MQEEPSLLDYLKSLLDPRRPALRVPEPERPVEPKGEDHSAAAIRADPGFRDEHALNITAERLPKTQLETPPSISALGEYPAAPPSISSGSLASDAIYDPPIQSEPVPEIETPIIRKAFPWRVLTAFLLAIIGQSSLEPPNPFLNQGVAFYLLGLAVAIWAYLGGEWVISKPAMVPFRQEDWTAKRSYILMALPFLFLAFIAMGGNLFTVFNVSMWLIGMVLVGRGLWQRRESAESFGAFLRSKLLNLPWKFQITGWGILLLAGSILVLFFRFYRLDQVPPEMFSDHAEKLQDVKDVLSGETSIFFPRNTGREFVQMYLTAFTARFLGFGLTFTALKMGVGLAGLVTFPFIYLLGAELGNKRVGLFAALFAGISYWLNVITRVALRFSLFPLFTAPTLYFLVRGLRRGNRNDFVWAGVFLGLGLHGYSPFRFVPIMVVLVIGLFLLHLRSRQTARQIFWQSAVLVTMAVLVFLPLVRFLVESPDNRELFSLRTLTRVGTVEREYPAPVGEIFLDNLWDAMTMFGWDNGETWVHSVVHRPALDVFMAALFYLGFGLLIIRYFRERKWEDGFLLLSIPFLMMPSILSLAFPLENPSLNRTSGAIIPVFIVIGLAFDAIYCALRDWRGGRSGTAIAAVFAVLMISWTSINNYDLIFNQYFTQFQNSSWNTSELGGVIRGFSDSVGREDRAWVIPWPHWVDTRLVGINAGVPVKDYAIPRERLVETLEMAGPKLFLFNTQDLDTLTALQELYPQGDLQTYHSAVMTKDFLMYFVIPSQGSEARQGSMSQLMRLVPAP